MTAGHRYPPARRPADRLWTTMQAELAGLSSDSVHAIALRSGHSVQRAINGQPAVVVTAVLALVYAARAHTHLPACHDLFRGPGIRCA